MIVNHYKLNGKIFIPILKGDGDWDLINEVQNYEDFKDVMISEYCLSSWDYKEEYSLISRDIVNSKLLREMYKD